MIVKEVSKAWGKEIWIVNNHRYCAKILYVKKKFFCSLHFHRLKDEVFYLHSGKIKLEYSEGVYGPGFTLKEMTMKSGDYVRLIPYRVHRFFGLKDSILFEASTHHDDNDSFRLKLSGRL